MVIESQETSMFIKKTDLIPCVTFVGRYPHREVFEADEDGLKFQAKNCGLRI